MRYSFADCVLDTQLYTLTRAGIVRPLRRKVFQVLVYLLMHRDRVVSREELCAQVWPGQFISETTLESCIKRTRQAIGDDGETQQLIQTRRGYGYRFIGAVETCPDASADAAGAGVLAPLHPPLTLPQVIHDRGPGPSPQGRAGSAQGCPETNARGEEAALQRRAPAAVGEWKLVTVLCCAVAAPPMGGPLAGEPHYSALRTLAALAQEAVRRYGGTLQPVVDDHIIALFGAPRAQEDHARCAVLAALDLQQRLRQPPTPGLPALSAGLAVRIGVHSGLVVVGELGHATHGQVTAVGAPTQGALWLQQAAAPGTLLVSAATYHLVQEEVLGAPCGSLVLEGSPPQPVYTIQGLRQRRAGVPQRPPRSASPFVGRQRELALLHDRLAAVRAGEGQVVSLMGPPGIGKTRLLTEFGRGLSPDQVTWYCGQCLAYGQAVPYLPLRDIDQQVCALTVGDAPETHTAAMGP